LGIMKIEFNNLQFNNGRFSLEIESMNLRSRVIGILGPNGAGKSTLLKLIDGILHPSKGSLKINGYEISKLEPRRRARLVSYLPQEIPNPFVFKAIDVVRIYGYSNHGSDELAFNALKSLGISDLAFVDFNHMSGGERRLVMLAGLIYQNSNLILMDEPESFLDIAHKVILREAIKSLVRDGKQIIIVLHDIGDLIRLTDEIVMMKKGRVLYHGSTHEVINERTLSDIFSLPFKHRSVTDTYEFYPVDFDE